MYLLLLLILTNTNKSTVAQCHIAQLILLQQIPIPFIFFVKPIAGPIIYFVDYFFQLNCCKVGPSMGIIERGSLALIIV